jgi:hypothetical protein
MGRMKQFFHEYLGNFGPQPEPLQPVPSKPPLQEATLDEAKAFLRAYNGLQDDPTATVLLTAVRIEVAHRAYNYINYMARISNEGEDVKFDRSNRVADRNRYFSLKNYLIAREVI